MGYETEGRFLHIDEQSGASDITADELSRRWNTSATSYIELLPLLHLPDNIHGLNILSIGEGVSDLVTSLNDGGANAHGIDLAYSHFDRFVADTTRDFLTDRKYFKTEDDRTSAIDTIARMWSGKKDGSHLAARFSQLPFQDASFDFTFAFNSIVPVLDLNFDLMKEAADEAIRVTRPGGKIVIAPLFTDSQFGKRINEFRTDNDMRLISYIASIPGCAAMKMKHNRDDGQVAHSIVALKQ